jgi:hypothetical protein
MPRYKKKKGQKFKKITAKGPHNPKPVKEQVNTSTLENYDSQKELLPEFKRHRSSAIPMSKYETPVALKDACYYKAKKAHKVFPSAYASGMIAKCRKNKGK